MIVLEKHSDYASHLQKQQRGKRSKKESNLNIDISHNTGGCIPEMAGTTGGSGENAGGGDDGGRYD